MGRKVTLFVIDSIYENVRILMSNLSLTGSYETYRSII